MYLLAADALNRPLIRRCRATFSRKGRRAPPQSFRQTNSELRVKFHTEPMTTPASAEIETTG